MTDSPPTATLPMPVGDQPAPNVPGRAARDGSGTGRTRAGAAFDPDRGGASVPNPDLSGPDLAVTGAGAFDLGDLDTVVAGGDEPAWDGATTHGVTVRDGGGVDPGRRPAPRRARHRSDATPPPQLVTLPGPLRRIRIRPAWGAVLGLALVGVLAVAILGVRAVTAAAAAAPTAVTATSSRPTAAASAGASAANAPGTAPAGAAASGNRSATSSGDGRSAALLVVHVVGRVNSPGVVRLPAGARVEDAVRSAGGPTSVADLSAVNLARLVSDGEQIVVPAKGEGPVSAAPNGSAANGTGTAGANGASGSRGAGAGRIDLNTADESALDALPGVGPVTARKIIEWRTAHGRFSTVDELAEVPGIGPKLLEQIAPLVKV